MLTPNSITTPLPRGLQRQASWVGRAGGPPLPKDPAPLLGVHLHPQTPSPIVRWTRDLRTVMAPLGGLGMQKGEVLP